MVLFGIGIGIGGCGGGSSEVIARVGAIEISAGTLAHWTAVAEAMPPATAQALFRDPPERLSFKQRALRFLISSTRTVGEAHESTIEASDAEASGALELLQLEQQHGLPVSNPGLLRLVSGKGETHADRVWILRLHMLTERLEQRELSNAEQQLRQAQLLRYYRAHKSTFALPERRDVAVIESFTKANAEAAKREIDSGKSLLSVVNRRDEEPAVGGMKRGLSRRGPLHGYEKNYFTARPHVLVGPLKEEIYYLFEVTGVYPARQQTFAEVRQSIPRMLIAGARQEVLEHAEHALDLKWRPKTRCRAAYTLPQCGGRLA